MGIRQTALSVKVGKTDAAVTNSPGVVPLANLAHRLGVLEDLGRLLLGRQRNRGLSGSAAAFDPMPVPLSGGSCIGDLGQLRQDAGLRRLPGIPALVVRHARRVWPKPPRRHPHAAVFAAGTG